MRKLEGSASHCVLICSAGDSIRIAIAVQHCVQGTGPIQPACCEGKAENWKSLPIGDRTAAVGKALVGTRYKHFTLEIDNRIESPSVNFTEWTAGRFSKRHSAFARMLNEPESNWTPERLLYLHRDGSVSRRPMHRRLSFAAALSGRLALR